MTNNGGYIYVLTNPSFPEYVKIGYADNVEDRVTQLNRSECIPFAFRIYAILHVTNRLADKNIHKLIDKFKPELRARENINNKIRVREFFAMSPQKAVELLETIGSIYGETPVVYQQTVAQKNEQRIGEEASIAFERKSPFSFYKCGIKNSEEIIYVHDQSIVCTVVGDREISYKGKKTSLSALARKLLNRKSGVQGTLHFTYKGEVLSALRKRLEDEGKYNQDTEIAETVVEREQPQSDNVLYFVMDKFPAKCIRQDGGYLLLKGSHISPTLSPSCSASIKQLRIQNAHIISADFVLLDDIFFTSSSSAAKFVSGSSINGKVYWKNESGILLKDIL